MDLSEVIPAVKAGTLDAQENRSSTPSRMAFITFTNSTRPRITSTCLVRSFCTGRRSTAGRVSCRTCARAAVADAVAFQRNLHVKEEEDAAAAIRKVGGEIVELTHRATQGLRGRGHADLRRGALSSTEESCCRSSAYPCNLQAPGLRDQGAVSGIS